MNQFCGTQFNLTIFKSLHSKNISLLQKNRFMFIKGNTMSVLIWIIPVYKGNTVLALIQIILVYKTL